MKDRTQREYYEKNKAPLLVDYVNLEIEKKVLLLLVKVCRLLSCKEAQSNW